MRRSTLAFVLLAAVVTVLPSAAWAWTPQTAPVPANLTQYTNGTDTVTLYTNQASYVAALNPGYFQETFSTSPYYVATNGGNGYYWGSNNQSEADGYSGWKFSGGTPGGGNTFQFQLMTEQNGNAKGYGDSGPEAFPDWGNIGTDDPWDPFVVNVQRNFGQAVPTVSQNTMIYGGTPFTNAQSVTAIGGYLANYSWGEGDDGAWVPGVVQVQIFFSDGNNILLPFMEADPNVFNAGAQSSNGNTVQQAFDGSYGQFYGYTVTGGGSSITAIEIFGPSNNLDNDTSYNYGTYLMGVGDNLIVGDKYVPAPEPISMIFFGTGLVAVGGYVQRKRMQKKA